MTSSLRNKRENAAPLSLETGAPTQIDEYAEWFNQRFTFAKARVLRDARGVKFLDIEYGK